MKNQQAQDSADRAVHIEQAIKLIGDFHAETLMSYDYGTFLLRIAHYLQHGVDLGEAPAPKITYPEPSETGIDCGKLIADSANSTGKASHLTANAILQNAIKAHDAERAAQGKAESAPEDDNMEDVAAQPVQPEGSWNPADNIDSGEITWDHINAMSDGIRVRDGKIVKCEKEIQRCVEAHDHDPACICDLPKGHAGNCLSNGTSKPTEKPAKESQARRVIIIANSKAAGRTYLRSLDIPAEKKLKAMVVTRVEQVRGVSGPFAINYAADAHKNMAMPEIAQYLDMAENLL